jgi:transformation/transcription domain-associated protein
LYTQTPKSSNASSLARILRHFFYSDFEGLGGRFWLVVFIEVLINQSSVKKKSGQVEKQRLPPPRLLESGSGSEKGNRAMASYEKFVATVKLTTSDLLNGGEKLRHALCFVAHGDSRVCLNLFQSVLPGVWSLIRDDSSKLTLTSGIETLLSRPFYSQSFKIKEGCKDALPSNTVKAFLSGIIFLDPLPPLNVDLIVYLAENYNSWYEALSILERQYLVLSSVALSKDENVLCEKLLLAMRRCYRQLGETSMWTTLVLKSCDLLATERAASLEIYGRVDQALSEYTSLMNLVATGELSGTSKLEMKFWEEEWVKLQREECQLEVVSNFASQTNNAPLMLECAWKECNWDKVRSLCASPQVISIVETGDPALKMVETLSAVAEGKLSEVENLHAQSSQLCLYKWRLLPNFTSASQAHARLLHNFHRLVEIRESGQIMVETNHHSSARTVPDLKNLLNSWRHRLPNDEEDLTIWDDIFFWRAHMFSAVTSNFQWTDPGALTALHDKPWTTIRMSTVARKQALRNTALLLLNRLADGQSMHMDVSDAFSKLREQILLLYNPDDERERTGGLNLINTTNLSYFDDAQKSELFRLKAIFLASLRRTSKSNQAYCHSVQICPTHSKSWISWGGLCSSLGAMTEKQADQAKASGNSEEAAKSERERTKRVAQYLAQAMGCFLEAVQVDPVEKTRIHLPKCLWMLTKDGPLPGVLCQTLEQRGISLPPFVWLPWIPQLLSGLCRSEGRILRNILSRVVKAYPQAGELYSR